MKILLHELPGRKPDFEQYRTINNMSDDEINRLGWWRLAKVPGVKVSRNTIKARVESGLSKREACTRPVRHEGRRHVS